MPSSEFSGARHDAAVLGELAGTAEPANDAALDLDVLYRRHAATVTRWASRLGGPAADIDDLVHEVFLAAVRGRFRGEAQVTTWLYRITATTVRRWRRRSAWRRLIGLEQTHEFEAPGPDPEEDAVRRDRVRLLYRILDRLPAKEREALILHELEELTGPEIAHLLGTTPNAVWVRLHRARKRFEQVRRRLEARENHHER